MCIRDSLEHDCFSLSLRLEEDGFQDFYHEVHRCEVVVEHHYHVTDVYKRQECILPEQRQQHVLGHHELVVEEPEIGRAHV